jgi:hypothetical protein
MAFQASRLFHTKKYEIVDKLKLALFKFPIISQIMYIPPPSSKSSTMTMAYEQYFNNKLYTMELPCYVPQYNYIIRNAESAINGPKINQEIK